jgi:hypothetical protein
MALADRLNTRAGFRPGGGDRLAARSRDRQATLRSFDRATRGLMSAAGDFCADRSTRTPRGSIHPKLAHNAPVSARR